MSCININSQEYKDILNEVGDPFDAHIEFIRRYGLTDDVFEIKPGVSELFEENPELANAVYGALGFNQMITPNDKVVFGHPTIGKSYLKKQGEGRFITLDDDYKDEVNAFVDANRGSETRQEYKGRKPKEYNEFMLNLYDRLKVQAQREGKILFVSNTNILKERMSDFDKVITIPKAEFKRRFDERGATYGFEDWKSEIDATVAKVPSNKVITTTGYLADLFITSQQKQQATLLYSQYLDSLNKPNTNPILQGNQQEQVKKFAELQERLNNKEFLEGAKSAYESTPALQELGTQEEYNDYIARVSLGIIKNPSSGEYNYTSKVKDIVYHGTNVKFDNFDKKYLSKYDVGYYGKGFYFSTKPNNAYSDKNYHRQEVDGVMLSVLLNLPNPNYKASNDFSDTGKDIVKNKGVIVIEENLDNELTEKTTNPDEFVKALLKLGKYDIDQIVVSEPEQIHILGGTEDIEGFKKFVGNQNKIIKTTSERPFSEAFDVYNKLLNETGEKPKSFEYNNGKYILNTDGTYDLTDPDTGSIFIRNIDIETGELKKDPDESVPLPQNLKQALLLQMIESKKTLPYEEMLAVIGYSYQDIFNDLVNAKNMAQYNKILNILNKLC